MQTQHTIQQLQIASKMRSVKHANANVATMQLCANVSTKCKRCVFKQVCAVVYNTQIAYLASSYNFSTN
jgi:hypothetical protein